MQKKSLYLIDAYALIFKYYYAFYQRPMRNHEGINTSVVFGFTKFLRDILKRENPDLIGVAFDPAGGCFRREISPDYKANRPPTPEDIKLSVPYVKRLLEAMCIPVLEVAGFEADDVIGTLAKRGAEAGYSVFMVTPDKDYGQLVDDNCVIYRQKGDAIEIIDKVAIEEKYGFSDPSLVCDVLALWGDASDNIAGVPGIGEKGASKLVREWGTAENILANADKIGGKTGKSIAEWGDKLLLAKSLAAIRLDVPIEFSESELTRCAPDYEALRALYKELNFTSLLKELDATAPKSAPCQEPQHQLADVARKKSQAKREAALEGQGDLFAMFDAPTVESAVEEQSVVSEVEDAVKEYKVVSSVEEVKSLCERLQKSDAVALLTMTNNYNVIDCTVIGIALSAEPFKAYYVPLCYINRAECIDALRPLLENESIAKIGQNIKFDIMVLRRAGIELRGARYDTMLLHYLIDSEARHSLDFIANQYLGLTLPDIETLTGKGAKQVSLDMVATERVAEFTAERVDVIFRLRDRLYKSVAELAMTDLYHRIEEPMIDVLADMELTGVCVDCEALARYGVVLNDRLLRLEREVCEMADEPTLNINSPRQLGEVLFGKLRITDKPKMTKTKQYSTDEEYLTSFANEFPIVSKILEYRGVKKLLSTYVEALPRLVNFETKRLHTSYNQAVTATGRLSSTNPNLQNIPIRDELGKPIREAFIASSGNVLVAADYSQIELRLMAHLSGDKALIEAFMLGEDIHSATAARLYGKTPQEVSSDERRRAKTANFGIIYGISAFGLAQRLDIPNRDAKELIENYFASYPDVKRYMDEAVEKAKSCGYVETMFARRRQLNDIHSANRVVRGVAERNAINAPIQGSAADIMKLAMVEIARRFKAEGIKSKMIMQVHDEVVIDTIPAELDKVCTLVREAMESVATLKVPLVADVNSGKNWLEAH
ncbi:MAG: DNA polymerase I [Alistipes sp.]|nr:DNA polymerase I [Alistipes sp.]